MRRLPSHPVTARRLLRLQTYNPRRMSSLQSRFAAFLAERFPFAAPVALPCLGDDGRIDTARLRAALEDSLLIGDLPETTPGVSAGARLKLAIDEVAEAAEGFCRRAAIVASLTAEEKREILRGMLLTRATDNRLKQFFTGGEVRWGNTSFQGKGFRSLGQEAIYAAVIRLQPDDVISPMIRDLGAVLAKHNHRDTVRMVLSAQMGKAGPPMNGKDLHVGDWEHGILPAMAPLGSPALTIAGIAMAFQLRKESRVAVSFVGEGTTSLGEWHEAINACAARKLPAVFCVQNNQTALSTPVRDNSAVRVFADKGLGYGIPSVTIDGTDAEEIAGAFTWAAERAREGHGPALIELVAMRMCGHAHHDDMLYLGKDPQSSWSYPPLTEQGYANRDQYEFWQQRDPLVTYTAKLEAEGIVAAGEVDAWKKEIEELVEAEARKVIDAPWPDGAGAGSGVLANESPRQHVEVLDESWRKSASQNVGLPEVEEAPPFDPKGKTFLDAVMLGVGDVLRADERAFVYGEDVGGKYGNAFLLLRPLLKEFGDRIINSVLSESATIGVCTGAALAGMRPIGEMQFNDFVASGFNALVNNAAKIRYRWGGGIPMVLRMPWGGLRHAGPYHSQNTEAWFYRTPGLKIVVPSTPHDARALMMAAANDPDPVLYYEHIALYRDPKIKQALPDEAPTPTPIGKAALRRAGDDLAIISYGAYVHDALQVAETLSKDGHECAVLDLRTLSPLDRNSVLAVARHCNRVLIVHEDTRTGSIGESLAAIIQEEAFEYLDAPVRILGALDTPVPYSPPLEEVFLPSLEQIETAARLLLRY
jgi:2-oxoisovalerate dehydrogenase E1 component